MTSIDRAYVVWSNFPGGPGVSVHYAFPGNGVAAKLRTFYNALAGILPINLTIQVPGSGDTIEDTTGEIVGGWSGTTPAVVVGTLNSVYTAPSGCSTRWLTGGVVRGRRLRGRTFIVPMGGTNSTQQGTWNSTTVATIQAAADALIASANPGLCIWNRPQKAVTTGPHPHPAYPGSSAQVTAAQVKSEVNILKSRRD